MRVNSGGGWAPKKHHKKSKSNHIAGFLTSYVKGGHKGNIAHNWGSSTFGNLNKKHKKKGGGSSGSSSHYSSGGSHGSGYSSGSSSYGTSHSGGSRGRRGGGRRGKKGRGSTRGVPRVNRREAGSLVQADINSQMLGLMNQARGQRSGKNYEVSKINALFDRSKGDLDYLFNEAKDYNTAQTGKIDQRFAQTGTDINALFDSFKTDNNSQVASRKAAAQAELDRLGIGQTGLGTFDADASAAASTADLNQSNANANLGAMKAGSDEIGALLQSMAVGSHESAVGTATNTRNTAIADANQTFAQYMQTILGKANEIKSQKFVKTSDLAQQLQAQRFSQFMQMRAAGMHPGGGHGKKARHRKAAANRRSLKSYNNRNARGNRLDKALGAIR